VSVLIVGASGLVGAAAIDAFLADGWEVVSTSRRAPEVFSDEPFRHLPLDLTDAAACRSAIAGHPGITHVVYAAVFEMPGLIAGWKSQEQMRTNVAMLRNVLEPTAEQGTLEHVTLLQGTKAYGVHHHPIRIPSRESEPRDPHENFYWLQEDFVRGHSQVHGYGWTILRPPLIVGPNYGVAMNLPPVIGAYAALRHYERRPFSYPGGPSYVAEAVDTRVLADAAVWAATSQQAWGEHFNISNGEVFEWRDLWGAMADTLGVDVGDDEPMRVSTYLMGREDLWQRIVEENGLRPLSITELVGESHHYADFQFAYGAGRQPPPALMSTVKLHSAGFCRVQNTEQSFQHWLEILVERRVLPRLGKARATP
jgi:nucleoside-diphosphate-sugar epimerase